ncbi:MAG: type IX secretion system sortase PorU, partial [Muribaculaceae bacterium]|nr:type IX secretion system sortase PorU [Muribaculaceae bacterium]
MKIFPYLLAIISIISGSLSAYALDASHYASNSVLSEGKWQRVKVSSTGMQFVSNSELKSMGFSDPSKVRVYGTGGAMVREALTADMPDDLPMVKSLLTNRGILFFGVDNTSWNADNAVGERHTLNPYFTESYYYLSDRAADDLQEGEATSTPEKGPYLLSRFEERIAHEKDIVAPSDMGRMMFGEDFRTTKSQTFNFSLPGIDSPHIAAAVKFGARTSNGTSQIKLSANGTPLAVAASDKIQESKEEFIRTALVVKNFDIDGDKLALNIDFSYSGALFTARLDYIEVFYDRALKIGADSELHFYYSFYNETVALDGCSSETVIWDVTNPCKPVAVDYTLEGNTAYFTPTGGYHEFVAFNPSTAGKSVTRSGMVKNQDIHGLDTPDMVIIAPESYISAANKIASLHEEHDGFKVEVLTPELIYNEFSGGHADVSAFRKLFKMWHDRPGDRTFKYALILGRGIYDYKLVSTGARNPGYTALPIWQSPTGNTEITAFSTDDYLAMLDDCTEESFDMSSAKLRVAVGRLPVRSASEADQAAEKIVKYVKSPAYGSWRNHVMLIADDQDGALHLTQSEDIYKRLIEKAPHYQYEKLYLDSYPLESTSVGNTYPKAKERMMKLFNEGVIYTNYIGHASATSWTHEKLLLWNDITNFSNSNLTFLIAATCSFGHWDGDIICGAETLVLNPTAGFIGAIVPSRTVFMSMNGVLNGLMANQILTTAADGGGTRFGDVFIKAKNDYRDDNKLRYCLMADPAIRLPKPTRNIAIESINGIDLDDADEFPELQALSKAEVKGAVNKL